MRIMVNGLYIIELHESVRQRDVNITSNSNQKHSRGNDINPKHLWYLRLGYINERMTSKLAKRGLIDLVDYEPGPTSESCLLEEND